jgi:choline dehydrogenase-like flavoprotein
LKIFRFLYSLFYSRLFSKDRYLSRFLFQPCKSSNGLQFIAEQEPKIYCKLNLSRKKNHFGQRKINVNFKWSRRDISSIIKAHYLLDSILKKNNFGKLIFHFPKNKLFKFLKNNCIDGTHQLGGLRMGKNYKNSVTNSYGQLFGASNVFISSSATFPVGGASAPTFTLIALIFRQVQFIIKNFKKFDS